MCYVDAIFNTAGGGGIVAGVVITALIVCYGLTIRWIARGHEDESERR